MADTKSSTKQSAAAQRATYRNPFIEDMPDDTIDKVCGVLSFLQWVESGEFSCDPGESGALGRLVILQACREAVESLRPARNGQSSAAE